jgi:hypothetical protein
MRLPQSIIQSLYVYRVQFLTIGATLLLVGLVPKNAAATAPQLNCSPSSLKFGALDVGQAETLLVTVTNSGETSVTLSGVAVSNSDFKTSSLNLPLVLQPAQSVDLSVSFTPGATGWTNGTIKFSSNASNPTLTLQVEGTGVSSESAIASPSALSFGSVATGSQTTLPVVITNARSWKLTVTAVQTSGNGFSLSGPTFPITLSPGQTIALNVTFKPQSTGEAGGSLFVYGPGLNIPLTGTGTTTGQLIIAPAPLNFGNVAVGTTGTEALSMSATGASVTVYSATSGNSQFALDGASFPFTIAAGQSLSFNVGFSPQTAGVASGSLSFTSNASNSQANESLTGTGTAAQYSVNLWWNSSQNVEGYNVYRSTNASGTYNKINSTLEANTAYTDSTVAAGQTYYYEATSVNSSGVESARSTPPVVAVVP